MTTTSDDVVSKALLRAERALAVLSQEIRRENLLSSAARQVVREYVNWTGPVPPGLKEAVGRLEEVLDELGEGCARFDTEESHA